MELASTPASPSTMATSLSSKAPPFCAAVKGWGIEDEANWNDRKKRGILYLFFFLFNGEKHKLLTWIGGPLPQPRKKMVIDRLYSVL